MKIALASIPSSPILHLDANSFKSSPQSHQEPSRPMSIIRAGGVTMRRTFMADYQERPATTTTVIEKRGGGGTAIAVLLLVIVVAIAAFFLISSQTRKDNAVEGAATQVGQAASDVRDAAKDAAKGE
jgi:hypothetical protein